MLLPEDAPADEDLGVSNAQLLMLKRTVAMQQWRETPVVTSDGKGGKSTTYAYERVWSTHEERAEHSPDHVNPKFPSGLPGGVREFQPTRMLLGTEDKLALNADLVKQVTNWVPLRLTREYMPNASKLPFKLRPTRTGTSLTNGESLLADNIGDLRVTFEGVLSGPYTAVAKLSFSSDGSRQLVPFQASLRTTLASQGAIAMPDMEELDEIVGVKLKSYAIPEAVINSMESLLLSLAPLQINYVGSGAKSKKGCFKDIAVQDYETKNSMRMAGGGIVWAGLVAVGGAAATTQPGLFLTAVLAAALCWKTIQEATPDRLPQQKPDIVL